MSGTHISSESPIEAFDPITLEVYWQRLISIAEEQAKTLTRTAFSSQAGEMEDISSGIFDVRGRMVAQGVTGTIGVITGLLRGVPEFLKQFPLSDLKPGDVFISNDPWLLAGHLNDIAIVLPVFHNSRIIGFSATMSHATDIGGKTWTSDYGEVYEEGICIPPMKLYAEGKPQDLLRLLRCNVRVPEQVIGDVMAQITACNHGARKLRDFCAEESLADIETLSDTILSRSEQVVRNAFAALNPGTFRSEVLLDGFDHSLTIAATLTTDGRELLIDFSGTSKQVPYAINSVYNYTLAHTVYAVKCALCPLVPNNEGCFRPIRVTCPEGLLLNASHPAPVVSRHLVSTSINAVVSNMLGQVLPEAGIAQSGGNGIPIFSGYDDRTRSRFIYWFLSNGGMGARSSADGINAISFPANIATVSAEIVENVSPLLVLKKELATDSGGPGKFRGGCGSELVIKVRGSHPADLAPVYERCTYPAQGDLGGHAGQSTTVKVNGAPIHHRRKTTLAPGDVLDVQHAGGGGFFSPLEREPEKVLDDVRNGYVSPDAARSIYKVAIDSTRWTVDEKQTAALRSLSA
jgi:N-methylhydantoinase B